MKLSVVLSTYNQPVWLEKVLWGYAVQSRRDFELVVADDGSGAETAEVVERFRRESGMEVLHVWHEDRGFRKTEILNRAILASSGDYLIFSDGDCIPRDDFVAAHARLARPGRFLSGTTMRLSWELSRRITLDDVRSGRFAARRWLREQGHRAGRRAAKLLRAPRFAAVVDALTTTRRRFDGCNASTWREALFAVNGFDAEMKYGWEDRSLGYRLQHIGFRGRQIRHQAVCLHLEHERPYKTPEVLRANATIRDRILRNREVRARVGLVELQSDAAGPAGGWTNVP